MSVSWKLEELAAAAGVSARTVRYYVQRGLLPPPAFRGRDTTYGREHLVRLRAIKKLQEEFLPLDAIQIEIERRSPEELERFADGDVEPPRPRPKGAGATEHEGRAWTRYELHPGVELHVRGDADAEARAIADAVLQRAPGQKGGR